MKIRKAVALSAAIGVALAGVSLSVPANADPVSNGYVIVGSDTLQDAVNALVNGTSITGSYVRVTGGGNAVASYDATGSALIQTKTNTTTASNVMARPVGSTDGKKALSRAQDLVGNSNTWTRAGFSANVKGQIDLARSSSGASTTAGNGDINNTTGALVYIPFGRDAVSYAIKFGTGVSSGDKALIAALTTGELQTAYTNATPQVKGTTTIVPVLPQTGSGTREFWLTVMTGSKTGAAPGVATANYNNTTLIENDGTQIPTPGINEAVIIPFSAASWVAQVNGATPSNSTAGVSLGSPNGVTPYTGTVAPLTPNTAYYASSSVYGRDIYIIAPAAKVIAGVDPLVFDQDLADLVNPALSTSLTYFPTTGNSPVTPRAVKLRFGFLPPADPTTFRTNLNS